MQDAASCFDQSDPHELPSISCAFTTALLEPASYPVYSVDRYYDPSTGQFLSVDPVVATTGEAFAYTGDDPVNDTDPSGLYDCSGKSASFVAARLMRGDAHYNLTCGVPDRPGQTGYGINHIQQPRTGHFAGDVSKLVLWLATTTLARGKLTKTTGANLTYVKTFVVNGSALAEPETFSIAVTVNRQHGSVVTI